MPNDAKDHEETKTQGDDPDWFLILRKAFAVRAILGRGEACEDIGRKIAPQGEKCPTGAAERIVDAVVALGSKGDLTPSSFRLIPTS